MAPLPNALAGVTMAFSGPAGAPSGISTNAAGTLPAAVSLDNGKPTYSVANTGVTLYSTAAAVLIDLSGSATRTIRIKRLRLWLQASLKFFTELQLLRSTTVSGGTPNSTPTPRPLDVNDVAATAVLNDYAAAATYGTGHLVLGACGVYCAAPAATNSLGVAVWDFQEAHALVLRGTTDVLEVYNTITGLGTATFGYEVVWEEDAS